MDLYQRLAEPTKANRMPGGGLLSWARRRGFEQVEATASLWTFANQEDRDWWGGMWRTASSVGPGQPGTRYGVPDETCNGSPRPGKLGRRPDGFLTILHGEILATA